MVLPELVSKDTAFQIIYDLWEAKFTVTDAQKKIQKLYHQEFRNVKFAAKVKEVCSVITGYPIETFFNREKYNMMIPGLEITVRELMQKVGDGLRREVNDNLWIRAAFSKIRPTHNSVFTDVRYPNEAAILQEQGAVLIKIVRPLHIEGTITEEQKNHPSENQIDLLPFDHLIINNGTLDDLKYKLTNIMSELWNNTVVEDS